MDQNSVSATGRAFATPELLEQILSCLLSQLLPITNQEDPRSVRTNGNARVLRHVLRCSEVGRHWRQCVRGSGRFQRALFLVPDHKTRRSWRHGPAMGSSPDDVIAMMSFYKAPAIRAPELNPMIQVTFPSYHFRYWNLALEGVGSNYCAYLIIARSDLPSQQAIETHSISVMFLSQPPCKALEATIWDDRDETREYIGQTRTLRAPVIQCEDGLTLGIVHKAITAMFAEHPDVTAIKLTTT